MNDKLMLTVFCLGLFVAGCGNEQNQGATEQPSTPAQGVAVNTSEIKAVVVQQAEKATADGNKTVSQLQQNMPPAATEMVQKAQALLTQAKQYLDQGKFSEAISTAQNVLQFDPQNLDAQKIIEMAKGKLKALAEQKAADVKSGVLGTLGTMGK